MGPVSGGKSTIVTLLKRGLEKDTRTDEGAVYAIKGCPMHEDPLHLIPHHLREDFYKEYGIRIEGNVDDEMLAEITHVEREISNFRSTSNNWADYVPLLRLLPGGSDKPLEYKKRRASYM